MGNRRKASKRKKKTIGFMIFILLLGIGILIFLYFDQNGLKNIKKIVNTKKLQIVDENSKSRPYAVMINNHSKARINHSGLQDAYIVYEAIAEGGITRLMAIFKDKTTERIGSVRSSRHYFLDYAMENDAIYVHFGWSPQAQDDIQTYGIQNINGLYDNNAFWRDRTLGVALEHTAFTSMEKIEETAKQKGYRTKTDKELLLNYNVDEVNISDKEESIKADNIRIPYSNYVVTSYTYNPDTKLYSRFVNDVSHTDAVTKKQYTTKNIIIEKIENYSIDSYGRQNLDNVGQGEGYYVTNGYAVPIIWEKSSRDEQTIYKYKNGEEIEVNDGNTYIQIQPIIQNTVIN